MPISEKERNRIESSIFFSFGEQDILNGSTLITPIVYPRPQHLDKKPIVAARLAASNHMIEEAHVIKKIIDKSYHGERKKGEPDWNEVQHDAQIAMAHKLSPESTI